MSFTIRFATLTLLGILLTLSVNAQAPDFVPNEVLVKFAPDVLDTVALSGDNNEFDVPNTLIEC